MIRRIFVEIYVIVDLGRTGNGEPKKMKRKKNHSQNISFVVWVDTLMLEYFATSAANSEVIERKEGKKYTVWYLSSGIFHGYMSHPKMIYHHRQHRSTTRSRTFRPIALYAHGLACVLCGYIDCELSSVRF